MPGEPTAYFECNKKEFARHPTEQREIDRRIAMYAAQVDKHGRIWHWCWRQKDTGMEHDKIGGSESGEEGTDDQFAED